MGRHPYKRIFQTNPEKVRELLALWDTGKWNVSRLADHFLVDRTSVRNQLKKERGLFISMEVRGKGNPIPLFERPYNDGTGVNTGKSYRDYMKKEDERDKHYKATLARFGIKDSEVKTKSAPLRTDEPTEKDLEPLDSDALLTLD